MTMSNSSLISVTVKSPNNSGKRTHAIDRITPHCVVGQMSAKGLGDWFAKSSTQASSNYGIGYDGKIGLYVDEANRAWTTGGSLNVNGQKGSQNDQRAVTIECASATKEPYTMNDAVYASLIKLCVDICERNGKWKLLWMSDKYTACAYQPKSDEMVLTVHRWFATKSCPGTWLYSRMDDLATQVTKQLQAKKAIKDAADKAKDTAEKGKEESTKPNTVGASVALVNEPLYVSSTTKTVSSKVTGTYYYWDATIVNGRIRITNSKDRIGKAGQVTGWIKAPEKGVEEAQTIKAGQTVKCSSTPLYYSSGSTVASSRISGTYYLWDASVVNQRVRITNAMSNVGVPRQVTGWINVADINGTTTVAKKTIAEVAKEVIDGKWGNGTDRKKRLEAAGYNYAEVQAKVNAMLK